MNLIQRLTHYFVASLSVLLTFGVLTHDVHADQIYAVSLGSVHATSSYAESEQQIPLRSLDDMRAQHTHVDYNPLGSTLANSFAYQSPSIAPRKDSHHGQLLRLIESGGRHAFDNANLPIIF